MTDSTKRNKPFLLGVAGGSGSGKTFFARAIQEKLGSGCSEIVYQDNFYLDQSKNFDFDGGAINFDHPDAIDFSLLAQCLRELKAGSATEIPVYDFSTHQRKGNLHPVAAKPVIIVDGILVFHSQEVRGLFDDLVFFETPEELRFQRRLERDVKERGRSEEGVRNQFFRQVKPMHDAFVEPSKIHARTIVRDSGECEEIVARYCEILQRATQRKR